MDYIFEVRPHGANSRLGFLPAHSLEEAINLHRIFGGSIIYLPTGWDVSPPKS